MNKKRCGLIVLIVIFIQLIIGITLIRPYIFTWGSSKQEASMPMPGDHLAPFISSTRSITINAPIMQVWDWLIQLGADRSGFYSYWFIEKALGYKYRTQYLIEPKFKEMKVGRIVTSSLDPSKSVIKYSWPVVAVDPGRFFVLKGWGCFLLNRIGTRETRLIVRTHGRPLMGWVDNLEYYLIMPLHYLMERRMLMGIKARAEAGPGMPFSSAPDTLWFLGIISSFVCTLWLLIVSKSIQTGFLIIIYSILWVLSLFVFYPIPIYSNLLLVIVIVTHTWLYKARQRIA